MITENNLKETTRNKEVWIGLFAVTGEPSNVHLDGCPGAYVTVLSSANDESEFRTRVEKEARALGLGIDEIVWSMTLKAKLEENEIEDYLKDLAREIETGGGTRFGIFHAWEN